MRISDWSSDVCSSDLQRVGLGEQVLVQDCGTLRDHGDAEAADAAAPHDPVHVSENPAHLGQRVLRSELVGLDRKSVVSGKSVSVSVDLGGRRLLTKQTSKSITHTTVHEK